MLKVLKVSGRCEFPISKKVIHGHWFKYVKYNNGVVMWYKGELGIVIKMVQFMLCTTMLFGNHICYFFKKYEVVECLTEI